RPSAALDHPQELATLFLPLQSASHLRPCDACGRAHAVPGRALGKEGIMHATLSPSWKKSLLLVFVSVVAFVTATPATSVPECFFQGLGFLPGDNQSFANGVNANGTVVVGSSTRSVGPPFPEQAFRWVNGTMTGLGFRTASGVSADGTVVVGTSEFRFQAVRWVNGTVTGLGVLP